MKGFRGGDYSEEKTMNKSGGGRGKHERSETWPAEDTFSVVYELLREYGGIRRETTQHCS